MTQIVSIVLAIGAIYLAVNGKEGWGWFLFGAIVTVGAEMTIKKDDGK